MPLDSSGNAQLLPGATNAAPLTKIKSQTQHNDLWPDFAAMVSAKLDADGRKPISGDLTQVAGKIIKTGRKASSASEVVQFGQLNEAFNSGLWNAATPYAAGNRCEDDVAVYFANIDNINKPPATSPAEWTIAFRKFQGGQLTSKLSLVASSAAGASLNIPDGIAPSVKINGDIWGTGLGLWWQAAGFSLRISTNNDATSYISGSRVGLAVANNFSDGWLSYTGAASTVPFTNAIPLSTAGALLVTNTYSRKGGAGNVKVTGRATIASSAAQRVALMLFSGATCIGVSCQSFAAGQVITMMVASIPFAVAAGSISYSLRVAQETAANVIYSNGGNGEQLFGGTMFANVEVDEVN